MGRGAGVLMVSDDPLTGRPGVLLGRRVGGGRGELLLASLGLACGYGHWSVPGGGWDERRDRSFLGCALREALEECWSNLVITTPIEDCFRAAVGQLQGGAFDGVIVAEGHSLAAPPTYEYRTFLVRLGLRPESAGWPAPTLAEYEPDPGDPEHRAMRWWPLDALPGKLHFGVVASMKHFRSKGLLP
jgi:8-oxo-dGTP pyrophosphatase MutT (NUDIX family)